MAYGNTDEAGNYAIVADNFQWADDRKAGDIPLRALKVSVRSTLRACGLPYNRY
jgi:hypothetical protein